MEEKPLVPSPFIQAQKEALNNKLNTGSKQLVFNLIMLIRQEKKG